MKVIVQLFCSHKLLVILALAWLASALMTQMVKSGWLFGVLFLINILIGVALGIRYIKYGIGLPTKPR